jgi:hypothetical protein
MCLIQICDSTPVDEADVSREYEFTVQPKIAIILFAENGTLISSLSNHNICSS